MQKNVKTKKAELHLESIEKRGFCRMHRVMRKVR